MRQSLHVRLGSAGSERSWPYLPGTRAWIAVLRPDESDAWFREALRLAEREVSGPVPLLLTVFVPTGRLRKRVHLAGLSERKSGDPACTFPWPVPCRSGPSIERCRSLAANPTGFRAYQIERNALRSGSRRR